jgi:hypothetical protein
MQTFEVDTLNQELFDEFLDGTFPNFEIGNLSYPPSQVLKAIDPIAYEQAFLEYLDGFEE